MVGDHIVVHHIFVHTSHEFVVAAVLQIYAVVHSCVVHQTVDSTRLFQSKLDGFLAFRRVGQFGWPLPGLSAGCFYVGHYLQVVLFIKANDDRNGSLTSQCFGNGFANSPAAAGNDNYFIL